MNGNGNRLRVLQVGKYFAPNHGGIESHLRTLSLELRKSVDVKVLVANDRLRGSSGSYEGLEVERLGRVTTVASAPICPTMVQRIRSERADIVHLHLPNPTAALSCLVARPRGALIITWHSDVIRQRMLLRAYQPFERLLLNRCAAIVASSPAYIASSPVLRMYSDRCHMIPFGIDAHQFDEDRIDRSLVADLRRRFGPRVILAVGRLVYYKGIKFLIQAMSKVDARLLIIGDGPLRAELEREAASNGTTGRVTFLGEVDGSLSNYYHASDVFALPSCERSEAFGIVQLEAMASGKPVVNTQLDSGVPFASLDGLTGFTVTPKNPDALATALNRLLDNSELRARMGRAARERVMNQFGIREMAARTLELYDRVVPGHSHNASRVEALPQSHRPAHAMQENMHAIRSARPARD